MAKQVVEMAPRASTTFMVGPYGHGLLQSTNHCAALQDVFLTDGLRPMLSRGRVLKMRAVSKTIWQTLQSDCGTSIVFSISPAGVHSLTAEFLQRWNGSMHLECVHPLTPESRWFQAVRNAFPSGRTPSLGLLSLSVSGEYLIPLAETLVGEGTGGIAIQELEISVKNDPLCSRMTSWLQCISVSNIKIKSIELR